MVGFALAAVTANVRAQAPFTDANWIGLGGYAGVNGGVNAIVADTNSGLVYFGGSFTVAGRTSASNIVAWDGANWRPLGTGLDGTVYCLAVDASGNFYAGGNFLNAGGVSANYIAKWDGSRWTALGLGVDRPIRNLTFDRSGNLYAGGSFSHAGGGSANFIANWDGSAWAPLGSGMNNPVYSLAIDSVGNLYAGGYFSQAGGNSAYYIAKWDGTMWTGLNSGLDGGVLCLVVDSSDTLYAAGYFGGSGTSNVGCVARWDGNNWSSLNTITRPYAYSLALDGMGNLYAGGYTDDGSESVLPAVARWDGFSWQRVGFGINNSTFALGMDRAGVLYAGGYFNNAGNTTVDGVAKWDGTNWSPLNSNGIRAAGPIVGMYSPAPDDLYVGSASISGTGLQNFYVGRLYSNTWSASRIEKAQNPLWQPVTPILRALALVGPNSLFVGGTFTNLGGVTAGNIAKVSGTNVSTLGSGCDGPVYSLAADPQGNLYAGGLFSHAGNTPANGVARWDGTNWSALGAGTLAEVVALAVDPLENVYAASVLSSNGPPATNLSISKWNGTNWSFVAGGLTVISNSPPGGVVSLAVDGQGNIYLGATVASSSGVDTNELVRWDGTNWTALGSGVNGHVASLLYDNNGHLFVSGSFTTSGTNIAYGFAEAIIGTATNPPALTVTANVVAGIGLSWPLDHVGWRLQSQRNPPGVGISTNWFTVPGSTNVNTTNFAVRSGVGSVFYRLVYP